MSTRNEMISYEAGKGRGSCFKIKIMKGMGLLSLLLICFVMLSINVRTASADICDCVSCHGTNHHDWSVCNTCHGTLGGMHSTHGAALSNTTYGDAIASDAGNYKFGCGHCHSLAVTTVAAHTGRLFTDTPNMELYNPNAAIRGKGPDQVCSECHGNTGPHGGECSASGPSVDCLSCHSITQGSIDPIIPGVNHHSEPSCTTNCHYTGAPNGLQPHDGTAPALTTCTPCHTAETTLKWNMGSIACSNCHTYAGVKPTTGTTVCAVCHGGSGPGKTLTQAQINGDLVNIHTAAPAGVDFTYSFGPVNTQIVNVTGTATCASGPCSYDWNFNNEASGSGASTLYTFAAAGSKTITLTVTDTVSHGTTAVSKTITVQAYTAPPTANGSLLCNPNWTASVTDTSTGTGSLTDTVNWGDGGASTSITSGGPAVNHTYVKVGSYTVILKSVDSKGQTSTKTFTPACAASTYSISGTTEKASGAALGGVSLVLRNFNTTQSCTTSPAITLGTSNATTGAYSFTGLNPGTYGVCASKSGSTFTAPAGVGVATVGPNVSGQIIKSVQ